MSRSSGRRRGVTWRAPSSSMRLRMRQVYSAVRSARSPAADHPGLVRTSILGRRARTQPELPNLSHSPHSLSPSIPPRRSSGHYRPTRPIIAAVEGLAIAGGTELLQAMEIRVAGEWPVPRCACPAYRRRRSCLPRVPEPKEKPRRSRACRWPTWLRTSSPPTPWECLGPAPSGVHPGSRCESPRRTRPG